MNRFAPIAILLPLVISTPSDAQPMDHMSMPGMSMPMPAAKTPAKPSTKASHARRPPKAKTHRRRRHTGHARSSLSALPMPGAMAAMPGMAAAPAAANPAPAASQGMAGMQMPSAPSASGNTMPGMPGMAATQPAPPNAAISNMAGMKGMDMPGQTPAAVGPDVATTQDASEPEIPKTPPPPPPRDHAADRFYDPAAMAAARAQLHREHGGETWSMVIANLAEYQARQGGGGYRWEGEASIGGDINRLYLKTEGEGGARTGVEAAEVRALYSRAISPYFNLQAGVRQDLSPTPSRTYATVGFEGLAPYWFEVSGAAFLSTRGEVLGRLEGYQDFRITQRLILQPRAELNLSAQNIPALGLGAGLTNLELGLRLRYEIKREFAPYIGVSFDQKFGATASYARAHGQRAATPSFVVGVRTWF